MHLKPSLAKVRLDRLNAIQIQYLYRVKLDSGLSPRTVQIIHTNLHKALKQAVNWPLVPRNVIEAVDPPKPSKREIRPLSEEPVKALIEAAEKTDLYNALPPRRDHRDAARGTARP